MGQGRLGRVAVAGPGNRANLPAAARSNFACLGYRPWLSFVYITKAIPEGCRMLLRQAACFAASRAHEANTGQQTSANQPTAMIPINNEQLD